MFEHIIRYDNDVFVVKENIVRCQNCKYHYETRECTSTGWEDALACENPQWSTWSLMPSHEVKPDGFCAWGEEKED